MKPRDWIRSSRNIMWAERRRVPRTDLKSKEPAKVIEERCAVR